MSDRSECNQRRDLCADLGMYGFDQMTINPASSDIAIAQFRPALRFRGVRSLAFGIGIRQHDHPENQPRKRENVRIIWGPLGR
jgi:hypothetical protein